MIKQLIAIPGLILIASASNAGYVVLEGNHALGSPRTAQYSQELLGGFMSSGESILVLSASSKPFNFVPYDVTSVRSLSGINLSDYDSLYVIPTGGCCHDPGDLITGYETAVGNFLDQGGNLLIRDYQGGSQWDSILGFPDGEASSFAHFGPHTQDISLTVEGLDWGFSPDPFTGGIAHQSYDTSFFNSHGFDSLVINPDGDSVLLVKQIPAIPVPAAVWLLGSALLGLVSIRHRQK